MTIFVDASAIVAMIAREPEARSLADCLQWSRTAHTSAIAIWEAARALARVRDLDIADARGLVVEFLARASIGTVAIADEEADLAIHAHRLYGKGVHVAALNMGDCFAYACTRRLDAAILFKGDDFIHTDLRDALLA